MQSHVEEQRHAGVHQQGGPLHQKCEDTVTRHASRRGGGRARRRMQRVNVGANKSHTSCNNFLSLGLLCSDSRVMHLLWSLLGFRILTGTITRRVLPTSLVTLLHCILLRRNGHVNNQFFYQTELTHNLAHCLERHGIATCILKYISCSRESETLLLGGSNITPHGKRFLA